MNNNEKRLNEYEIYKDIGNHKFIIQRENKSDLYTQKHLF